MDSYNIPLTKGEIVLLTEAMHLFENNIMLERSRGRVSDDKFDSIEDTLVSIVTKFGAAAGLAPEDIFD